MVLTLLMSRGRGSNPLAVVSVRQCRARYLLASAHPSGLAAIPVASPVAPPVARRPSPELGLGVWLSEPR
jgi:hypothetical protein